MSMPSEDSYSDEKNFKWHPPYLLNMYSTYDIIFIEAPFPQFYIFLCSVLNDGVCLSDLFNLQVYENVHYVRLCN